MIERNSRLGVADQGLRYFVSGGLAAIVDIGAFSALYPKHVGPLYVAATLSFLLAAAFNYCASSFFVFGVKTLSLRSAIYFLVAATLGLALNVTVTVIVVAETKVEPVLAKAVGIGTAFLLNFILNRYFVFGVVPRS
ncbi:GtrA family protein [Mesorhizobium ventifaucium]|uniref:Candidate membrane protein n=1 Tax=Mesorhizobium ventifaucium TaxID=666020 RepID=A0ABM9DH61_9HYPH|nr:GtrA family protein [Mesorhizobium ventifaucium]CAH2395193.1 Candidate membrane protein [Mesorhizobium ventifaucium]